MRELPHSTGFAKHPFLLSRLLPTVFFATQKKPNPENQHINYVLTERSFGFCPQGFEETLAPRPLEGQGLNLHFLKCKPAPLSFGERHRKSKCVHSK